MAGAVSLVKNAYTTFALTDDLPVFRQRSNAWTRSALIERA